MNNPVAPLETTAVAAEPVIPPAKVEAADEPPWRA